MPRKKHSVDQIIGKLRQAEVELSKGETLKAVVRKLGIAERTYYRWRKEYGCLKRDQAKRFKVIERENARLKRIVADQQIDGERLWVLDRKAKGAIALSPQDGSVVKRLKAPLQGPGKIGGIGWYKGKLAITAGGTEHHGGKSVLLLVDPANGELASRQPIDAQWGPGGSTQIGDDLWIAHGCWMCVVNPETGETHKWQHPYLAPQSFPKVAGCARR